MSGRVHSVPPSGAQGFHPTEFINDELEARGWDKFDLLARMGGDPQRTLLSLDLYFIVGPQSPNCRMGDVLAHQMAVALDVAPQFLLNLERAWLDHPATIVLAQAGETRSSETTGSARKGEHAVPEGDVPND